SHALADVWKPRFLGATCASVAKDVNPDVAIFDHLRQRYEKNGTKVAIYIAPIPDCDPIFDEARLAYDGLVDHPLYAMPHQDFGDDGENTHLSEAAAAQNSEEVARFVAGLMK